MRGALGLVSIILALAIGMFIYRSYFTGSGGQSITMGTNNPRAAADLTGVKNDLNAMAQAERAYMALNGKYVSLEELRDSGNLTVSGGRFGYSYTADISERGFVITATYSGPATGMPTLSIDETMQITRK